MKKYPISLIEMSQNVLPQFETTNSIDYNNHFVYKLRENFYGIFNHDFTDVWTFNSQTGDYRHIVENDSPVFEDMGV